MFDFVFQEEFPVLKFVTNLHYQQKKLLETF